MLSLFVPIISNTICHPACASYLSGVNTLIMVPLLLLLLFALLVSHLQTLTDVRIEQKSYLVVGEAVAHGSHPFS